MNHYYYYTSQWRSIYYLQSVFTFTSSTFPFNTLMKNLLVPGCSHRYQLIGNRNIAASSDINIKLLKERFPHEIESIFLGAAENTTFKAFNCAMCLKNVFMLMLHEAITTIQKSFVRSKLKAFCRFQSLHFTHLSHKGLIHIYSLYIYSLFVSVSKTKLAGGQAIITMIKGVYQ